MECLPFEFSGCGGNDNNFDSLAKCQSSCHLIIDHLNEKDKSIHYKKNLKYIISFKSMLCYFKWE